jgi:hypothetical protein
MAVVQIIQAFGTFGAWGLVYAPMMLCSCFAAFKYIKWFQAVDDADARGGLVQAWNVQILGWCISYVFACVMVVVAVPTVSAAVSTTVNTQVNSALAQHGAQMTAAQRAQLEAANNAAQDAMSGGASALRTALLIPILVTMLIGCCIQAYYRQVSIDYARDGGWASK